MDYQIKEDGKIQVLRGRGEGGGYCTLCMSAFRRRYLTLKIYLSISKGKYKVVIPMLPLYDMPVATTRGAISCKVCKEIY